MKQVGLIRVLTTDDRDLLNRHGALIQSWYPEFTVTSECIPNQPEGIHDDATEELAVPKVIALARDMEQRGMEAIVISCAGDPAVGILAKELSVPVIGAGRSAGCIARALEKPVGVLGITAEVPAPIKAVLGQYLVADAVPQGVESTLDLMKPAGMEAVIEAARQLKERGAEVLVLACTGLATIGAALPIRKAIGIPVIDPVRAEAAVLWTAIGGN
jgi:Asp/Glu/hydantoin racemase